MIEKNKIEEIILNEIENTELYLVELKVSKANCISVLIDSLKGVQIATCIGLSKAIEKHFDREVEDFELEVASAGIGQTFLVIQQYHKNINRNVEVLTSEGKKILGVLKEVNDEGISLEIEEIVKIEGKKKKQKQISILELNFDQIKTTKDIITF